MRSASKHALSYVPRRYCLVATEELRAASTKFVTAEYTTVCAVIIWTMNVCHTHRGTVVIATLSDFIGLECGQYELVRFNYSVSSLGNALAGTTCPSWTGVVARRTLFEMVIHV